MKERVEIRDGRKFRVVTLPAVEPEKRSARWANVQGSKEYDGQDEFVGGRQKTRRIAK